MSNKPYRRDTKPSCGPPCPPVVVEPVEPELPMLYCAGEDIPLQAVGLVTIRLKDGTEVQLVHGSTIPANIDGYVIMDIITRKLKHVPGPADIAAVTALINTMLDSRDYVTQSQLDAAIAAIVFPHSLTEAEVKGIVNACLLDKNYMNSTDVCLLLDVKVPAAIAAADIKIDPIEVINVIQSYLGQQGYVTLAQVKTCINDALTAFEAEPDRDAIKAIALDCFKEIMDDLIKDGFSYVESGTLVCTPNGTLNVSLKQSNAADVTLTGDLSKFFDNEDTNTKIKGGTLDCLGDGLVRLTLCMNGEEPDVVITGNLADCFEAETTAVTPADGVVTSGSATINSAGILTTRLNRSANLPDIVFTVDLSQLEGGADVSQCVTGLSSTVAGNVVTQVLSQANCPPITSQFTLPTVTQTSECISSFTSTIQNRLVTLAIAQDNCGTVNTQFTIPESTGGGGGGGEVTGLTLTCNAQRRVTFGLNQTVGNAQTVTADFTSCFPDTNTLTETAGGVPLNINPVTGRQVLPTAEAQASNCVDSIAHTLAGNDLTTTIVQDNCPNKTTTITLPTAAPACINDYNHVISGGVLTSTIKQDGCSDKVAVVTLPATTGGSDNCITNHILSINNNVLTSSITQDNCPATTANVTLPTGAVSSTVTSGTHVCNTAGTLTTTINQSGAAPVSFSADLSKFLDNTDTNTTVVSGGMSCNNGVVTTTINQSSGPAVTFNADLSSCFGSTTDTKLASVVSDVVNPNSQNSRIDLDYTLSDASVVTGSISGVDLAAAIKSFITCVEVTEPGATCKTYNSLRFDGAEICKLPAYEAPEPYCQTYCVGNIEGQADGMGFIGQGEIKATVDDGSQWTITWPNGSTQTVNSGSTAAFNFNGDLGQITICHTNTCANITELVISPLALKDTISTKGCGC